MHPPRRPKHYLGIAYGTHFTPRNETSTALKSCWSGAAAQRPSSRSGFRKQEDGAQLLEGSRRLHRPMGRAGPTRWTRRAACISCMHVPSRAVRTLTPYNGSLSLKKCWYSHLWDAVQYGAGQVSHLAATHTARSLARGCKAVRYGSYRPAAGRLQPQGRQGRQ